MKRKQNAFTLIELLVVIAIIAILAISIAVGYSSVRESANDAKRIETSRNIATAQEIYYQANDSYASLEELIDDGYLSSDPDDSGISPHAGNPDHPRHIWDNTFFANANSTDFYVRVMNHGDDFCCTEEGCREIDNYTACGWSN